MLSLSSKKIIHRVTHASNVHTHTLDGCSCAFDEVKNVITDKQGDSRSRMATMIKIVALTMTTTFLNCTTMQW